MGDYFNHEGKGFVSFILPGFQKKIVQFEDILTIVGILFIWGTRILAIMSAFQAEESGAEPLFLTNTEV